MVDIQKLQKDKEPVPQDFGLSHNDVRKIEELKGNHGVPEWFNNLYFIILFGSLAVGGASGSKEIMAICLGVWVVALLFYMNGEKLFTYNHENNPQSYKDYVLEKDNYIEKVRQEKEIAAANKAAREKQIKEERRKSFEYWSTLDPYEFEKGIASLFNAHGFNATPTKGSGDGGIDILLKKGNKNGIVQCKRQQTKVSPAVLRDLYGTMVDGGYDFGFVVCPASFSEKSYEFSKGKNIGLIGLKRIMEMVNQDGNLGFLNIAGR